eukprot:5445482-Heterocapsa_arctica.AAC.1
MLDDLRRKGTEVICQNGVSSDTGSGMHIVGKEEPSTSIDDGRRFHVAVLNPSPYFELISVGKYCVERGRWSKEPLGMPPLFVKPRIRKRSHLRVFGDLVTVDDLVIKRDISAESDDEKCGM